MADESKAEKLCEDMSAVLNGRLRLDYPFLKQDELVGILEKVTVNITHDLALNAPAMAWAKARVDLFSLSAELRNQIYELALLDGTVEKYGRTRICSTIQKRELGVPPLLQTSRQVRSEALAMFYCRTFVFDVYHDAGEMGQLVAAWLENIGSKTAAMIKKIELNFWMDPYRTECMMKGHYRKERMAEWPGEEFAMCKLEMLEIYGFLGLGLPEDRFSVKCQIYDYDVHVDDDDDGDDGILQVSMDELDSHWLTIW